MRDSRILKAGESGGECSPSAANPPQFILAAHDDFYARESGAGVLNRLGHEIDTAELSDTMKKVSTATDGVVNSSQLFRECAMKDAKIPQAKERAIAPIRGQADSHRCILVVDDDSDTRQLSVDVLAGSGYDVEGVEDGAAGWEALQNNSYDLVITDNKMPRMTGIEMIEKLRSARMTLPVIMATRYFPVHEFDRKPWLKPAAALERPFSNDDLLETVRKVLRTDDGNDGHKETLFPKHL
jgi:CheY-like chemotaxis protein